MKKILITGAAGNIGYELQKQLQGDITLLDKNEIKYETGHKSIKLDLSDRSKTNVYFSQTNFDTIIHLAAISRVSDAEKQPIESYKHNVAAVENILAPLIDKTEKPHIIFTSSREVYGASTTNEPFTESSLCNPQNIYGETKVEAEVLLQNYANQQSVPVTILRLANVYGGENDLSARFVPQLISSIINGTNFTLHGYSKLLDFVHISDVVSIIETLTTNKPEVKQEIFNIASGISTNLKELVVKCHSYIEDDYYILNEYYSPEQKYEVDKVYLDNNKAMSQFQTSFKQINDEILKMITIKEGVPA